MNYFVTLEINNFIALFFKKLGKIIKSKCIYKLYTT